MTEPSSANNAFRPAVPYWVANVILILLIGVAWPIGSAIQDGLNPYFLDVLIRIGIAIMLAVSLNLINGITGQFSLGHAGFMGIGAYVAGVLTRHWADLHGEAAMTGFSGVSIYLGVVLLGGALAAVAGLGVGLPTLRLRGDYLAIATLGFGEIIAVIIYRIEWIGPENTGYRVGGAAGLHDIPIVTNVFWAFAGCLICIVTVWRMSRSAKGTAFFAVREDEIASAAMGVNTTAYKIVAFTVGAFFAGVAGALSATWQGNLTPDSFRFMRSVEIVVMVVLGGSGSITGSILAAIILTWLPEQLRFLEDWRLVIYSLLLIVMMIVRPTGLLGSRELWFGKRRHPRSAGLAAAVAAPEEP